MRKSVGEGIKEMFLRERVVQLEHELREATGRQELMEGDAKQARGGEGGCERAVPC